MSSRWLDVQASYTKAKSMAGISRKQASPWKRKNCPVGEHLLMDGRPYKCHLCSLSQSKQSPPPQSLFCVSSAPSSSCSCSSCCSSSSRRNLYSVLPLAHKLSEPGTVAKVPGAGRPHSKPWVRMFAQTPPGIIYLEGCQLEKC